MRLSAPFVLVAVGATASAFAPATGPALPVAATIVSYASSSTKRQYSSKFRSASTQATASALRMSGGAAAAVVPAEEPDEAVGGGTATISQEIFNLVKGIVGAGVLSLPAGIASFSDAPAGLIPAVGLIASIGMISGYGFSLIGRVCSYTGAKSYREAWSKSVGKSTDWIPAVSCTFKTSCACLAYSLITCETFKSLFATVGLSVTRTQSLLGVTGVCLFPLCLLKNLGSLAPFSLLGTVGMVYTMLAMAVRYVGKGYLAPAGRFLPDVAKELQPAFGDVGIKGVLNPNSFILICMLSTAYMAHFNAPKFYTELKNNTIKRYNTVVSASFGASIALMAVIASLGFLTFGAGSSPLILNNYSSKDVLMSLSRVAVAVSIVFSYPLAFAGLRDGVIDILGASEEKRKDSGYLNKMTAALLGGITGLALVVKDLAFVLSFGGATLGNALIYVYPALMFRSAVKNMGDKASKGLKREVPFALFSALLGIVMGGIGATMAVKSVL
mmetsp:Transcript_12991/g.28085  ORF Transcript_12991/g.28085 Transcript_12991/m.28085 type:complete len:500 (+) Transcript_12991:113-1612(+)|eukprot:CAMPEP_0178488606 /NCGR_PEP_ID=MMETSP0696-20121128/9947_1 /TAXON_ID=265572 /ORGANISM="Extubocellulus spinifer, Strain CCMP396" /LENGTH=499 /DNA_ID=CAMNT_0020116381 /DNA_START=90 /DNA_END=1589 /DNA_ORIENTATION=+